MFKIGIWFGLGRWVAATPQWRTKFGGVCRLVFTLAVDGQWWNYLFTFRLPIATSTSKFKQTISSYIHLHSLPMVATTCDLLFSGCMPKPGSPVCSKFQFLRRGRSLHHLLLSILHPICRENVSHILRPKYCGYLRVRSDLAKFMHPLLVALMMKKCGGL